MNVRGFHHLAIQVRDVDRQAAFYREVLGLTEQARHHRPDGSLRSVWMALPDGGFLALEAATGAPAAHALPDAPFKHDEPGLLLLALRIDRAERADVLRALERHGVAVSHQSRWSVYLRDPEGNRIALSHHPEDPLAQP